MGVAVLFLAKMVTTSFSIGSGGSGGVFGPSLFIGTALGGSFAGIFMILFPGYEIPVTVFVLLGMVGFFAGAANAPISTVIIVSEMTGVFSLLVPFLWVSIFGYIFSQQDNIYENQIRLEQNLLEIVEDIPYERLDGCCHDLARAPASPFDERDGHRLDIVHGQVNHANLRALPPFFSPNKVAYHVDLLAAPCRRRGQGYLYRYV